MGFTHFESLYVYEPYLRMLRTILIFAASLLCVYVASSQSKIGDNTLTIDSASILELESTSRGFLPSRLTTVQRDAQTEWDEGHIIYNSTESCLQIYNGASWDCFVQGVVVDSSIYKYNGTLQADRVITMNGNQLTFDGSGDVVITSDGFVGIGDPTPDAKLDVEGGTVRLSDYGSGTNNGSESFLLGVDSEGDVIEVSPAIDTFLISNDTLKISLKGDTSSFQYVELSPYLDNTDDQIIDSLALTGTTLEIGLEGDSNGLESVDLSGLQDGTGTDDQTVDNFTIDGSDQLLLSLEDDGVGNNSVDLSPYLDNTDDQIIDSLALTGTTLEIGLEGDSNGLQSVDLSGLQDGTGTDDQTVDNFTIDGSDQLLLSLEDDGVGNNSVDLSPYLDNTDDQIIDSFALTGTQLELRIEGDVNRLQTVDLSTILGSSENIYNTSDSLEADRVVTLDGNSLTFDGTDDGDLVIEADGDIGIGTSTPSGDLEALSDENHDAFKFTQEDGTTAERDVFTIEDQDAGGGRQGESSVLKVVKSGAINATDNGFSLVQLSNTGADPGASKYWISGRKTDEGAPLWGVDITDNDFWSEGGIVLGVTGADGGTYSGGNFIVEPDGDVGIGTTTPGARLEVDGGSVIFDEYGVGTYNDTSANYILATDASGNVVELNTATNTRWFYAPSINIDASDTISNDTIDLYQEYFDQFSQPEIRSTGAPTSLPYYNANELWYYVTYSDDTVINNITIDANGVMVFDIIDVPFDNYTVINIIMLVK